MTDATIQPRVRYDRLQAVTGNENVLILVPAPGAESRSCGGLIAESCRRGRPPFVMVLGDGTGLHPRPAGCPPDQLANLRDRETRAAVACLGLPRERLLMAGVYDGQIPAEGAGFDAVVRGVTTVMWARDCNVISALWPGPDHESGQDATWKIACAVAGSSGVGLLAAAAVDVPDEAAARWRLDISGQLGAKRAAMAAHASQSGSMLLDDPANPRPDPKAAAGLKPYETFFRPMAD